MAGLMQMPNGQMIVSLHTFAPPLTARYPPPPRFPSLANEVSRPFPPSKIIS